MTYKLRTKGVANHVVYNTIRQSFKSLPRGISTDMSLRFRVVGFRGHLFSLSSFRKLQRAFYPIRSSTSSDSGSNSGFDKEVRCWYLLMHTKIYDYPQAHR